MYSAGSETTTFAYAADDAAEPDDDAVESREHTAAADLHGLRLDKALVAIAPEFSRTHLQRLIADGLVSVGGETITQASRRVRAGEHIAVELEPTAEALAFTAEPMSLAVVFEDEHLLVVDKPAGLVVHPAPGHWSGTLLNGLLAHHAAAARLPRAGIVHRLDKDTSGLLVIGKTEAAVAALARDIAARRVQRRYLALAHGAAIGRAMSIEAPIGRDPRSRVRMAVVAGGKPARTDVAPVAWHDGINALRCALHTGRTHQIRVHLAARGHPLLADALYGGKPALGLARQALHAAELALAHPVTAQPMCWSADPPPDLAQAWQQIAGR
jgi:23S rRNA pseudouridine1911/1915/1917 synthase